jgi:prevent-host-death family protein
MEEFGLMAARDHLGELVNKAQFGDEHTLITRMGKPAAVLVGADWYAQARATLDLAQPEENGR